MRGQIGVRHCIDLANIFSLLQKPSTYLTLVKQQSKEQLLLAIEELFQAHAWLPAMRMRHSVSIPFDISAVVQLAVFSQGDHLIGSQIRANLKVLCDHCTFRHAMRVCSQITNE